MKRFVWRLSICFLLFFSMEWDMYAQSIGTSILEGILQGANQVLNQKLQRDKAEKLAEERKTEESNQFVSEKQKLLEALNQSKNDLAKLEGRLQFQEAKKNTDDSYILEEINKCMDVIEKAK